MNERRALPPWLLPALLGLGILGLLYGSQLRQGMTNYRGTPYQDRIKVMGTLAHIKIIPAEGLEVSPEQAVADAFAAMEKVNRLMNPYDAKSDLSRLNHAPSGQWVEVHPLLWQVILEGLRFHRLSEGAFDMTIGPLLSLYDYQSGEMEQLPDPGQIAAARKRVGSEKIEWNRNGMRLRCMTADMSLDLGAIAKGFAVDQALAVLQRHGVQNAMVEAGGEIRLIGNVPVEEPPNTRQTIGTKNATGDNPEKKPKGRLWRTGLRHPRNPFDLIRTLELSDCAIATSGDYEKFFEVGDRRYSHIIDPRTGLPVSGGVVSATVILKGPCMKADALATTFSVLGVKKTQAFLTEFQHDFRLVGSRVILYELREDQTLRCVEFEVTEEEVRTVQDNVLPRD